MLLRSLRLSIRAFPHSRSGTVFLLVTALLMGMYATTYSAAGQISSLSAGGSWSATGGMTAHRANHTATLLPSGKVLVAGGVDDSGGSTASAELYDPIAGMWSATGRMTTPRAFHTATLLTTGKVLVTSPGFFGVPNSAELYDPATGTWSATGSLTEFRGFSPTATLLGSGKVLVVGGFGGVAPLSSAEIYDPIAGTWAATGSTAAGRDRHTATLLPSGKVLVAGGRSTSCCDVTASAELYDPVAGTWSAAVSMTTARSGHTATRLSSGKVLVASGPLALPGSAEIYDAVADTWTATGGTAVGRPLHTATLLATGEVLVAGGIGPSVEASSEPIATAELFDTVAGIWSATGSMSAGRRSHTATLLSSGKVLVAGGYGKFGVLSSAELYTSIPLDTTPPDITASTTPSANADGWNNSDVVVIWNVSDPESGIVSSSACETTTIGVETAGTTLTCSARNGAGLTNSASVLIKIDKTAPIITFNGNAGTYTVDQTILVTCVASDTLSGIATTSCPTVASGPATNYVGTTGVTSTTFIATATDDADNSTTASTTFTVTVTADGICRLSASLATADDICTQATSIATAPNATAKAGKVSAFDKFVAAQSGKSIPADLATLLSRLAHLL